MAGAELTPTEQSGPCTLALELRPAECCRVASLLEDARPRRATAVSGRAVSGGSCVMLRAAMGITHQRV